MGGETDLFNRPSSDQYPQEKMLHLNSKHFIKTGLGAVNRAGSAREGLWVLFIGALLLCTPSLQAEVRGSSNFKMQADGLAPAINMESSEYKMFSIAGDGRAVKLSSSNKYKLGSSVVYVIGGRSVKDSLCFPIRLQDKKSAVVCL